MATQKCVLTTALCALATVGMTLIAVPSALASNSSAVTSVRSFPVMRHNSRPTFAEATAVQVSADSTWGGLESLSIGKLESPAQKQTREQAEQQNAAEQAAASRAAARQPEVRAQQAQIQMGADGLPVGFNPDHPTGDTGNGYGFSQCTWWVYIRRHELGLPVGSRMGNGAQWANSARQLGYWVDNEPRVGDIMVFAPGQAQSDSYYGHVAVVEAVSNGAVTTSETGASYGGRTFSRTFTNIHDFEYIHY